MPLFAIKKRKDSPSSLSDSPVSDNEDDSINNAAHLANSNHYDSMPKLVFHCQLAHGSRTGFISDFCNMKQLYEKIAESLAINFNDVSELLHFILVTLKVMASPNVKI